MGMLSAVGRRSRLTIEIVLGLVSSVAVVYALELFLFWDPLELRGRQPRAGFDQRRWLEVVTDLRKQGTSAFPVLGVDSWLESPPVIDGRALIPLAGVPRATIVLCNETGSYVTYESDRYGFNAPDAQWDARAAVALVGDSFVEGWCVPRAESFAGLVRLAIPGTLNVGFTGHGPLTELGAIREYVAAHRPAHVFWFYYTGNDLIADLPRELQSPVLRRYLEPGFRQELQAHAAALGDEMRRLFDVRLANWEPPDRTFPLIEVAQLQLLRDLVGRARTEVGSPPPRPISIEDFRPVLEEAKRTVEGWGGSLHFVYLPDLATVVGGENPADHDEVLGLAADLGLDVVDLLPDFRNDPAPLALFPYEEGGHLALTQGLHYSRLGHRRVASRVLAVIEQDRAASSAPRGSERARLRN